MRLRLLFVLLLFAGCAKGSPARDAQLELTMLSSGADGFVQDDAASGPLDRRATAAAATQRSAQLPGFRGGSVRVWRRGHDFERVLAVRLSAGAPAFVAAELAALRTSPAATLFAVDDPHAATGVLLTADTRSGARGLFCQEVLFSTGDIAFEVATCSPDRPGSAATAISLARLQAARAAVTAGP